MFPERYFPARYYPERYFAQVGAEATGGYYWPSGQRLGDMIADDMGIFDTSEIDLAEDMAYFD